MGVESDRELLELAAKAAGIKHPGGEHCINGPAVWDCDALRWWRPLTDDGDALRLAVELRFDIAINLYGVDVFSGELDDFIREECRDGDEAHVARRAIVRAAAEIGRAM